MGIITARHKKRSRPAMRSLVAVIAVGVAGVLTVGSTSMAMATETPVEDEVAAVEVVETAPVPEEVVAPEQPVAAPVAPVEEQPAAEPQAEAPTDNTPPAPEVVSQPSVAPANKVAPAPSNPQPKKVFVCKYVGTPGTDERLQTGNNPISVSVNSIQNNTWNGVVPGWFSDAHDRSYVIAYDTGQGKPDVSSCPQPQTPPSPSPEPQPEPVCVKQVTWSYTFDGVGSGTVTATATKKGEKGTQLCDPLAVRAATYTYDLPASGSPSWPQTPVTPNDVLVDTLGTFSFNAPPPNSCVQHDIYAAFVNKGGFGALTLPEKLLGSNNPFEPPFLHEVLKGKGPNPTWSHTSSEGCNTPPVTPEPKVEYTDWVDQEWTCDDTEVTQTRVKTTTPYKVVLQDGKWVTVVDTDNITTVTETQTRELTEEEIESCVKPTPTPTPTPTDTPSPTPTPVPTVTPTPTTTPTPVAVVVKAPPKQHTPKGMLATTGADSGQTQGLLLTMGIALVAGTALVLGSQAMRRRAQQQK